jgi:hypothetical protein
MGDNLESEAEPASPPPGPNKVEITVAGHTVNIESFDPLTDVIEYAVRIFEITAASAKHVPLGFDTSVAHIERAGPYVEPGGAYSGGDDNAGRLGGQQSQSGTTRRLVLPDSPGNHRARLRPVPVDREQRPLS